MARGAGISRGAERSVSLPGRLEDPEAAEQQQDGGYGDNLVGAVLVAHGLLRIGGRLD